MHLKISAVFTFMKRPKDHLGVTSQRWTFGQHGGVTLFEMCRSVLGVIFDFYCALGSPEEMNEQLDELRKWLAETKFGPPPSIAKVVKEQGRLPFLVEENAKGRGSVRPLPYGRVCDEPKAN